VQILCHHRSSSWRILCHDRSSSVDALPSLLLKVDVLPSTSPQSPLSGRCFVAKNMVDSSHADALSLLLPRSSLEDALLSLMPNVYLVSYQCMLCHRSFIFFVGNHCWCNLPFTHLVDYSFEVEGPFPVVSSFSSCFWSI
jgi:hypothetical protein